MRTYFFALPFQLYKRWEVKYAFSWLHVICEYTRGFGVARKSTYIVKERLKSVRRSNGSISFWEWIDGGVSIRVVIFFLYKEKSTSLSYFIFHQLYHIQVVQSGTASAMKWKFQKNCWVFWGVLYINGKCGTGVLKFDEKGTLIYFREGYWRSIELWIMKFNV